MPTHTGPASERERRDVVVAVADGEEITVSKVARGWRVEGRRRATEAPDLDHALALVLGQTPVLPLARRIAAAEPGTRIVADFDES